MSHLSGREASRGVYDSLTQSEDGQEASPNDTFDGFYFPTGWTTLKSDLYPFPFDDEGEMVLTFEESIAATRDLERQINALFPSGWQWKDLQLTVIERHAGTAIYKIMRNGLRVAQLTVNPFSTHPTEPPATRIVHKRR